MLAKCLRAVTDTSGVEQLDDRDDIVQPHAEKAVVGMVEVGYEQRHGDDPDHRALDTGDEAV